MAGDRAGKRLAFATLLVRDYDEAIAWFVDRLGFELAEDVPVAEGSAG